MPTIGMPKVKISFESMGLSAIQRSERGIVLLLLKADSGDEAKEYQFTSLIDLPKEKAFSEDIEKLIKLAFEAHPHKLIVELYNEDTRPLEDVLKKMAMMKFNYYSAPNADAEDVAKILSWHKLNVTEKDKTFKFVAYNEEADDETVINWAVNDLVYDDKSYTGQEFTALVSSQLASLPLTRSFTYFSWGKISQADLPFSEDEDEAVNQGKLFLTYDGEKYKIARGVNSLTTYSEDKGEDFSKIRIVEAMHLIKDDIRETWEDNYAGKILNKYENKQQFIALVNQVYFKELEDAVLDSEGNSHVDIDLEANRAYAIQRGAKVEDMTEMQIKTYNTGSNVFLAGTVSLLDAMEDLTIKFRNL